MSAVRRLALTRAIARRLSSLGPGPIRDECRMGTGLSSCLPHSVRSILLLFPGLGSDVQRLLSASVDEVSHLNSLDDRLFATR